MNERGSPPLNHPAFEVYRIGAMRPWICSYIKDGKEFGITLFGTDAGQVLNDNCADLPGLQVLGEQFAAIPADDREAWRMIDEYERKNQHKD